MAFIAGAGAASFLVVFMAFMAFDMVKNGKSKTCETFDLTKLSQDSCGHTYTHISSYGCVQICNVCMYANMKWGLAGCLAMGRGRTPRVRCGASRAVLGASCGVGRAAPRRVSKNANVALTHVLNFSFEIKHFSLRGSKLLLVINLLPGRSGQRLFQKRAGQNKNVRAFIAFMAFIAGAGAASFLVVFMAFMAVCMYVCMYVCMHVCMYVCIHVCMYVCMRVCMHVCMYVCVYACMLCM